MNYPTIVYNTAHNQGRNHKHLASRSAEEVLKMKPDRTLCLLRGMIQFIGCDFHSYEWKIKQLQGQIRISKNGEILFSLPLAELCVMNTGLLTEVRPHASLYGIAVSPPCHVSYIHTSLHSGWLRSQWLPAPASTHTKAERDTPRLLQGSSSDFTHVINGEYGNITETRP